MIRDIGSIYPIPSVVSGEPETPRAGFRTETNIRFLSLCREALSLIARRHSATTNKRVLLPAYTCHTVVDPFLDNGWTCAYYSINLDLTINVDSLVSKCRDFAPAIIVVHPYHGMGLASRELDALRELKTSNCIIIEDLTQCIFSTETNDVFDYRTGSLRKWMPMPDGAFVASNTCDFSDSEISADENTLYIDTELAAMKLRGEYFATGDTRIKEVSRHVDAAAQSFIDRSVSPHAMSRYSQSVIAHADFKEIAAARRRNFDYLLNHLTSRAVTPQCSDISRVTSAPLYFPVLCKNRAALFQKLIPARIYAPVLWPLPNPDVLIDENTKTLYSSFLAIPIDQRYDTSDMDRIIKELNDAKA